MRGTEPRRRRAAGTGEAARSLAIAAATFALGLGAWLGTQGVTTSGFTFTLTPLRALPLVAFAFAVYLVIGALVLLPRWLFAGGARNRADRERRLIRGMAVVTLWAYLILTFLPLKGSEEFVQAGRLTTFQLNVIGLALVLVAGLVIGWLVSLIAGHLVAFFRAKFTSGGVRALGLAAAAAAFAVLAIGSALHARGLSSLSIPGARGPDDLPRVLIVGVDGADWEKLEPLIQSGALPTFQRLTENGCYGPLMSIEPLVSPMIWTSIATGKVPLKHGIYGFTNEDNVPVNSTMRRASPIWDIVSGYGAAVGVVGWYVTWPVDQVNGFLVSDRIHSLLRGPVQAFQSFRGHPTNGILESFGRFDFDPAYKRCPKEEARYQQNRIVDEPLRWGYLRDTIYGRGATFLCARYRPTFAAVYFRGVDFVQHFFWKYDDPEPFGGVDPVDLRRYGDVIPNYYVYQDRLLGELLEAAGDDVNVILVSDHGFRARLNPDPGRPQLTGTHDVQGVFIASGPAFRSSGYFEGATVLDIAPTALAVMGLPVPQDMDGRVLERTIRRQHFVENPLLRVPSYEPAVLKEKDEVGSAMDESIREQLRSLGYIE